MRHKESTPVANEEYDLPTPPRIFFTDNAPVEPEKEVSAPVVDEEYDLPTPPRIFLTDNAAPGPEEEDNAAPGPEEEDKEEWQVERDNLKNIPAKNRTDAQKERWRQLQKLENARQTRIKRRLGKDPNVGQQNKRTRTNTTSAERMARWRQNQTADQRDQELANDRERHLVSRSQMSEEQRAEANAALRERMNILRDGYDEEQRAEANAALRERMNVLRDGYDDEQRAEANAALQERMNTNRLQKQTKLKANDARHGIATLNGTFKVSELCDSLDAIGSMDIVCKHCNARKFKSETPSTCCMDGKVKLASFNPPPPEINNLWFGQTTEAKLFRDNARSLNNALCLASVEVKEKRFSGWTPSVIFEGRVTQRAGPLLPESGEKPKYAQLYCHDPQLATGCRVANLNMVIQPMSAPNKEIMKNLVERMQAVLQQVNPFIRKFMQMLEVPDEQLSSGQLVISANPRDIPEGAHARTYNLQSNVNEVSVLTNLQPHDLVIRTRGGSLQRISDLNPSATPLHFTLLFPHGDYGYNQYLRHVDGRKRVSPREYYVYYLNVRSVSMDYIFRAGKLFQEYVIMAFIMMQSQRLNFQRQNQKALRADTYRNVREMTEAMQRQELDGMYPDDHSLPRVGRKILSSSLGGSPRWLHKMFQNAMAVVREYHKPDFFITMTTNPHWKEITDELAEGQRPEDRPDVVTRVFKHYKDQLLNDLIKGKVLGHTVAHLSVIEWQKRGLPHVHILVILQDSDRPKTPEDIDNIICAELPPDPDDTDDPEEKSQRQRLECIVKTNMVHGPCGTKNPGCVCMQDGVCSKHYPKEFQPQTILNPENNFPVYRRRHPDNGGRKISFQRKRGGKIFEIDNRDIVPYNPMLLLRYNCHINVESCLSPMAAKYLYKYVTKGHDRSMVRTEADGDVRDEIQEYEDLRLVYVACV